MTGGIGATMLPRTARFRGQRPSGTVAGRRLRIGLIAPPWMPVPPVAYGGIEMVIDLLARGLVEAGHDVTLFTTGESTCTVPDRRWIHREAVGRTGTFLDELRHVQAAHEELADCDVIHDHTLTGPRWAAAGRWASAGRWTSAGPPVVATAHGEFTPELISVYARVARRIAVVAVSQSQRSTAPSVPIEAIIHHGLDASRIPAGRGDGGYVLFLGRMHEGKGVHRAIRIARAAGKRLLIAAETREPEEYRYFEAMVEPMLGSDTEYLGAVGGSDKLELLAGAEALINPVRRAEPFGLAMIEALAAGTPVVAFRQGSAPEIVDDGVTGFLCEGEAQMAARLAAAAELDRAAARSAVEQRFTAARMVHEHLVLYRRLVDSSPYGNARPRTQAPPQRSPTARAQ